MISNQVFKLSEPVMLSISKWFMVSEMSIIRHIISAKNIGKKIGNTRTNIVEFIPLLDTSKSDMMVTFEAQTLQS